VAQVVSEAARALAAAGCDTPRLDAEVLLAHLLDKDRPWLYAHPEHPLSERQLEDYRTLVSRRLEREPVAYIVGHKEFFGLDFIVTPGVLIPRPETELLVETALGIAEAISCPSLAVADVGTGSGAIAVTLARHLPRAQVVATDISSNALDVARRNALRHHVADRVFWVQGDLLAPLCGPFHLVVANPPYLRQAELAVAPPEVTCWEPSSALNGGIDGLRIIRRLLKMSSGLLHSNGALLVEIGAEQGTEALSLARQYFPRGDVEVAKDLANRDRLLVVRLFAKAFSI
jgi:release factor glutamine methyltransferase